MTQMTQAHWNLPDPVRDAEFYADVPVKRAIAWFVDSALIFLLTVVIIPFTAFTAFLFYPLLWLVVSFIYRVVALSRRSATPGMRLMSIEFRTWRGERFGGGEAVLHTLIYSACVSFVFPQLVSIVLMVTTARGQGVADLALGTTAVNRSAV